MFIVYLLIIVEKDRAVIVVVIVVVDIDLTVPTVKTQCFLNNPFGLYCFDCENTVFGN